MSDYDDFMRDVVLQGTNVELSDAVLTVAFVIREGFANLEERLDDLDQARGSMQRDELRDIRDAILGLKK